MFYTITDYSCKETLMAKVLIIDDDETMNKMLGESSDHDKDYFVWILD